ncbi:hypothetical protein AQUCO_01700354v1 [Aquilegia coerulea]|uniref:non-specific serine/threonine protein kinase n=2 Tax=Aquilegia coerulea TaxID=218851 RepID=A0A2G5DMJ8_AQUCA|nr:hypothetical protein AQUCO_01700354v1 [Aquilegia coerulea]
MVFGFWRKKSKSKSKAMGNSPEITCENNDDCRPPLGLRHISVSAQDLRALDIEKEKMDKTSPRGVLEDCMRSLEYETGSPKTSTSDEDVQPNTRRATPNWGTFFRLLKSRSMRRLASIPPVRVPKISRKNSRSMRENPVSIMNPPGGDMCCFKSSWRMFTLTELQIATNNFNSENMIGKGGYAEVYKGCLEDGLLVAVKKLNRGTSEDKIGDFLAELGIIVHADHPNIAKLIGYGIEGGMHLVLHLSPHGNLASLLHGSQEKLKWGIRYNICLGTAEGLLYLHEGCQRRIIHRDIKASNILLTEDFEPQICDFGLAKWLPTQWTHHTVPKFEGTFGYLAPEYSMHGIVDEKTDVYAFGVVLLEIITGRRPLDNAEQSLVMWAKPLLEKNAIRELVDPSLGDAYDPKQIDRVALTASLCVQYSSILRPRMSQVVQLLRGDEAILEHVKRHRKPFLQRTYSEELLDAEEYNSTKRLSDLNRHRQLAFQF